MLKLLGIASSELYIYIYKFEDFNLISQCARHKYCVCNVIYTLESLCPYPCLAVAVYLMLRFVQWYHCHLKWHWICDLPFSLSHYVSVSFCVDLSFECVCFQRSFTIRTEYKYKHISQFYLSVHITTAKFTVQTLKFNKFIRKNGFNLFWMGHTKIEKQLEHIAFKYIDLLINLLTSWGPFLQIHSSFFAENPFYIPWSKI